MIEVPDLQGLVTDLRTGVSYNGRVDGPTPTLEALTAAALYQLPDDAGEPLLGPMVRRGERLLIGAATGEGKTTFAFQLIAAVSQARSFLDWVGVGGNVLVVDAEQSRSDLKRLCVENGLEQTTNVYFVHVPDGLMLQKSEEERRQLEEIIVAIQPVMVVADPLYKLTMGADLNKQDQSVALMRFFDHMRIEHNFNLTVPVHCRKPPPKVPFSINEIHGAGAWTWGAETVIGLQLEQDGFSKLHFFKHRAGRESGLPVRGWWGLTYSTEMGFQRSSKTSQTKGTDLTSTRDEIRDIVLEAGPAGLTMDYIATRLGKNRSTVSRILNEMKDELRCKQVGRTKVWFRPETEPTQEVFEIHGLND